MNLMEISVLPLYVGGNLCCWWTLKKIAVIRNSPQLWDGADLVIGILGAAAMFPMQMLLLAYDGGGSGPAIWIIAMRRSAIVLWALPLALWIASMAIQEESDIETPESLRPVGDRAWDVQLGWIPVDPTEGNHE